MAIRFHKGMTQTSFIRLDKMELYKEIGSNYRALFKDKGDGNGFDFAIIKRASSFCGGDPWADPSLELEVDIVAEGTAMSDGVRHMYWNTADNDLGEIDGVGYLFWPDLLELSEATKCIYELVQKYCAYPE